MGFTMRIFYLIIICTLFLSVQGKHKKTCAAYLARYAAWQANFTQCTINHAFPRVFCDTCLKEHVGFTTSYEDLITAEGSRTHKNCKDLYFNNDKLNVIEAMHQQTENIWQKAFCSDCFSNETKELNAKILGFESCFNYTSNPCQNCSSSYVEITNKFKDLMKARNGSVCFAVQEKMNETREKWEEKCGKNERKPSRAAFVALSTFLSLIQILFYGGFAFFKKDENEYHRIDPGNESAVPENQPQPKPLAAEYDTSKEKRSNDLTLSDSSEDELPLVGGALKCRNNSDSKLTEMHPYLERENFENGNTTETSDDEILLKSVSKEKKKSEDLPEV